MTRGKVFECEIMVSPAVEEKLLGKHRIELWEIEEAIYDDPHAFSIRHQDCYFIYGQTFSGRNLLVLVRILSSEEILKLALPSGVNVLKVITAREMNKTQRQRYLSQKGS
jgi:hypothetical protein